MGVFRVENKWFRHEFFRRLGAGTDKAPQGRRRNVCAVLRTDEGGRGPPLRSEKQGTCFRRTGDFFARTGDFLARNRDAAPGPRRLGGVADVRLFL